MAKGKKATPAETIPTTESVSAEFEQLPPADNAEKANKSKKVVSSLNDELDLERYSYDNLTGQSFKDYVRLAGDHSAMEIVEGKEVPIRGELELNKSYDFVLLKATPVMQARFPGIENTPYDYVGLKAEGKPLHTTRIPLKTALEFNRQILNAHSRAGHGKYYFLKK